MGAYLCGVDPGHNFPAASSTALSAGWRAAESTVLVGEGEVLGLGERGVGAPSFSRGLGAVGV